MGCHIHLTRDCIFKIYPLVICYIAIEHGHRNSVFFPITVIALCFTMVMLVYQRVYSSPIHAAKRHPLSFTKVYQDTKKSIFEKPAGILEDLLVYDLLSGQQCVDTQSD